MAIEDDREVVHKHDWEFLAYETVPMVNDKVATNLIYRCKTCGRLVREKQRTFFHLVDKPKD